MNKFKYVAVAIVVGIFLIASAPKTNAAPVSNAQVNVDIGVAPDCPYGYYDYAPYDCAPYGYYGPEWYQDGVFIGTGPWFHGHDDFRGHVDNHYDVHHGYKGETPHRGDKPEASKRPDRNNNFRGNEMHDGHGHVVDEKSNKR